jgi:hypothetical protein
MATDTNTLTEELRALIAKKRAPSWKAIAKHFDDATPSESREAVDLVAPWLDAIPLDFTGYNYLVPEGTHRMDRHLPRRWREGLLAGEDHPRYGLVRLASFYDHGATNKALSNLFSCPSLDGVRLLDVAKNKVGGGFFKKLVKSGQFDELRILRANNTFKAAHARGLIELRHLPNLRYLSLGCRFEDDALDIFTPALREMRLYALNMIGDYSDYGTMHERHLRDVFAPETLQDMRYIDLRDARLDGPALVRAWDALGDLAEGEEQVTVLMGDRGGRDFTGTHRDLKATLKEWRAPNKRIRPVFGSSFEATMPFYDCLN